MSYEGKHIKFIDAPDQLKNVKNDFTKITIHLLYGNRIYFHSIN